MIYSDKPIPYLFVHNPRTSGTSLSQFLVQYCNGVYKKRYGSVDNIHAPIASMAKYVNDHFCFGFVRNPFSRELSLYRLYSKVHELTIGYKEWVLFRHGDLKTLNLKSSRVEQVVRNAYSLPQYGYFANLDGHVSMNVYKFESRADALNKLADTLQVKASALVHFRPSEKNSPAFGILDYQSHYDFEMIDAINEKMRIDLDYFGYDFNGCVEPKKEHVKFSFLGDPTLYVYNYQTHLF